MLDYLFVPCGGGGLLSGSAVATKHLAPNCRVIGVESAAGGDATRSFHTGVLGLAALFNARHPVQDKRVGVIISGGNVDMADAAGWFSSLAS